ncbi:hypothetical protein [Spirosoma sp. KNUC1025]|uniref:COG1470 family protein n=1 Tax=Spirosoma sp. KNUC1025 TaxID=2894082 RepID=UPI00386C0FC5|nr:hypothetical protein LN737_13375 [Spirosoma sp. KNUC1025]
MYNIKKLILTLSIITIYVVQAEAQSITVTLWQDSTVTSVGKTFTNRLTFNNTSKQEQEIVLKAQFPTVIQLLSAIPERLSLLPGQTAIVPVKGLVDNQASSSVHQVSFQVSDTLGNQLKVVSFPLLIKGKLQSALTLYSLEETIVLFSAVQSARLPMRLVHNRMRVENFSIDVASMPVGVDRSGYPRPVQLAPNQDTTFTLEVNSLHNWSTRQPYQLIVTVRDEQKSIVGTLVYKLIVAVDNKRYISTEPVQTGGYGASTAITRFSTNQWAKEARVWGSDSVGKAQIDFHLHYLNSGSDHFQQLQNSFISVRTDRAMVRLGSSYDYHELPLFGRGLKVTINQTDRQWSFWAINSNPNWLSPDDNAWSGNIYSARYDRQLPALPGASWSVSSNYYTQTNTMRAGYLNFATFRYDQSERHSLQLLGGQSVEFARQGINRAQTYGWAGQLNYGYQSPKLSWQFRSYLSSPVYAGLQRGATLIYSQLFWQPSVNTTFLARLNHMGYDRVSFSSATDFSRHKFGNTVAEVSFSYRIKELSLSFRPYWFSQTDMGNPFSQRADAFRFAPSISYHRQSNQHIEISYDAGIFHDRTAVPPQGGWFSQRLVSSIALGPLSFWGYYQTGPYYLFDLRNRRPDQMKTASLTPTIDFSLLNKRLFGSVGLNYLYDATADEARYIGVGRVQYDVSPNLSMQLSGNGTPYSQRPELAYSLYRLEVVKRFNKSQTKHHGHLQLSFFEDTNGDGNKDASERWMDSLFVTVNENTLLTNAKGSITYRNIPPGDYHISAVSASRIGDPVLYHESVTVGRSAAKIIPLARTFQVKGQLQCKTNAYERQTCQFNRFGIDIQRGQQTITSASPLPDGTFAVHLSPGDYTLVVRDYARQPQATVKTTSFTLSETGKYPQFEWIVDGSTRPVEVKRFSAR